MCEAFILRGSLEATSLSPWGLNLSAANATITFEFMA